MIERTPPRSLQAVADPQTPCKICGTASPLFDVVDFHEDCHEADGRRMALSGIPVYYYRCPGCGFLFTRQFDDGGAADFAGPVETTENHILNLDQVERRARDDLALLKGWFGEELNALRILALGNAILARLLRESGCAADSHDQVASIAGAPLISPDGRYDMILAFDILEQVADPTAMMQSIDRSMVPDGLLLLSTRLSDGSDTAATGIRRRPLRYVSPRMGQISIYNACSLALILGTAGFRLAGTKQGIHIGLRAPPAFARHLFQDRPGWGPSKTLSGSR
jgi:hypothetical protein